MQSVLRKTANRDPFKMRMFWTFLVLLMLCGLYRAQKQSSNDVEIDDDVVETHKQRTEEGKDELTLLSDILTELWNLRDMVAEQRIELERLTTRVTATEILVEVLQQENAAMKTRITAAESLVEELQMEKDELGVLQQRLIIVQERLTTNEHHVDELQKQQEVQNMAVLELQSINSARKVSFSASLLATGEGNSITTEFIQLIFKNIFTNAGNHYNPNTGYFTAPLRGVYYFIFTGHLAQSDNGLRMRLVKNSEPMVFSGDRPVTSVDAEESITNSAALHLDAGDVVYVQFKGAVWDDQYHRTTFSGFLLFAW